MTVQVAVAQFAAGVDKEENLKLVREAIATGADAGAELVVTPEVGMYYDHSNAGTVRNAEPLDGPFLTSVRDATRAAGVTTVVGLVERLSDDEARASNTLAAIAPDGSLVGVYRKVHLYDAFGYAESDKIRPAEIVEPLTFDLGEIRFGAMTCYDVRFPEMARTLVDAGATAIVLPAAWAVGPAKEDHWATLVRARAIENTCYVVASGQTGPHCTGQSMIVDPMGTVLASAGERPGTATARLEAARIDQVRRVNPSLANRRFQVLPR
ncbi:carbon-nitrogen hydrolase family protein [Pseudonocardia acaciae]|uniref:carbon-nitrogen hydrolase family protein n=1 Tax=Pseudonocardia acaciae TaxID=551276 RepID=UPI00048EB613|nr:carbon-nitrogen hydrolase family protein [Pseudonocardia acaciae]